MRQQHHRPTDDHGHEFTVTFDIETIARAELQDGLFPPWPRHRPVVAAFLSVDWVDQVEFRLDTVVCVPGEEQRFYQEVDRLLPSGVTSISYNGRGFDYRVLQLGAMAAKCFSAPGLQTHAQAQRFGRNHCDLADQFSGYGSTRTTSLAEICETLQIPVKTSVSGSDVGALWRRGEHDKVIAYVAEDVCATWIAWLHWSAFRAGDDRLIAVPLDAFARWVERTPGLEHLLPFATCPPARWARSRAPYFLALAAQADAERRVQREADERAFRREPTIFF